MWRPIPRPLLLLLPCALLALGLAACGEPSPEDLAEESEAIRQTLLLYLPKMADAYATGDVEQLEGMASQKERAILDKNVRQLAQQGRTVKTELRELTIEELNLISYANAYVTTVEEWDVRVYAQGTERLLGEDLGQVSRVQYQLKRQDGEWLLLSRNSNPVGQ